MPAEYQTIPVEECRTAAVENARLVEGVADDYERQMVEKGMIVHEADVNSF